MKLPALVTVWNNTMMYGEVRRGISEHTTCAVIPQAVRLSASEYGGLVLTDSDSLPVPTGVDKSYCS